MKYTLVLRRTVHQYGYLVIEAEDLKTAMEQAIAMAESRPPYWRTQCGRPELTVEEVEEIERK